MKTQQPERDISNDTAAGETGGGETADRAGRIGAFLRLPTTQGGLLIAATALALIAANSGLAASYHAFFGTTISIGIGGHALAKPLALWVNDGLMAIFFFAIGLEIKRELLIGHLSSLRRAALPIIAALGGMIVPAALYALITHGGEGAHGWGIPMATDIAFAVGAVALLGRRVPAQLRVFLLALAIVDDLGAVLVIAIFYTDSIVLVPLLVAIGGWLAAIALNAARVRSPVWYAIAGVVVWLGMLQSGVHATIAGVMMGFAIPARTFYDGSRWLTAIERALGRYRGLLNVNVPESNEELGARQEAINDIEQATEKAQSPLVRLEHEITPWVALFIMPLFAFTNAGVAIDASVAAQALSSTVAWGVVVGLVAGKQIGVFAFSWLAVRLGAAERPEHTTWRQFYGVAMLAGIGFTMSLFVTELSFDGNQRLADMAKLGILAASGIAGVMGYLWLRQRS